MPFSRPILKRKLAQMYYPDCNPETARRKFRNEIHETPGLLKALIRAGYDPKEKNWYLSPKQIQVIIKYLKEP